MGAWGIGNFDNDTALDWVIELEAEEDLILVQQTLDAIDEEYVDATEAEEALVAIETIARLKGNFGEENSYAEELDNWVKAHPMDIDNILIDKAKKVLRLIFSEKSELYELWEETDEFEAWKNEIVGLKERL